MGCNYWSTLKLEWSHFLKNISYMCDWTLHCSIICDTIYVYIIWRRLHYWVLHDVNYIHRTCAPGTWYFIRVWGVFLRDVMTFTYYMLYRNFIFMYVMPYISTWCQLYLHTTRCPGTWYFMRDSVVYFYVMSLASIYCEHSGNLRFYVCQCHLSTTWFHHTLWLSREIYMLYWWCL